MFVVKTKTRRRVMVLSAAAVVMLVLPAVSAVWAQSESPGGVPAELAAALYGGGWSQQAVEVLGKQETDWSPFRARDAELLASALQYVAGEDRDVGPLEQSQLALEICRAIREMEALGYGEPGIARAVFAGVRSCLQDMAAWRTGRVEGSLGQRLRSRFLNQLRIQMAGQAKARVRQRATVQEDPGVDAPAFGPGPQGAPGRN
jgi:hypothetical protein